MSQQLDKNTLGYLGIEFQYKLVKCFIEEPQFYGDIASIVTQNSFTDPLLRTYVGTLKDYYDKHGVVPSYGLMSTILRSKANTDIEVEEWEGLGNKLHFQTSLEGYETTKELAIKFFKQQNIIKVANQLLEITKTGDLERYTECQQLLDNLSQVGNAEEMGFSPFDYENEALTDNYRTPIPTGIKGLDEELNGGLQKQKLGIIIGSAGFGKTTFSTAVSSFASTYKCELNNYEGYKCLYIFFEDDKVDITRKVFANKTGVEARIMTKSIQQIDEVRQKLSNLEDRAMMERNLRLCPLTTGEKSASDIENLIKRLTNTGWKPDMVIVDYFECLVPERGGYSTDSEWKRQERTMRKLESMAKKLDIAIWVPVQGNKGSMAAEIVTMDQAGGAVQKVQIGSVIISIARSILDQSENKATLAILKNRGGRSGKVFQGIKYDNGTCTISCEEVVEHDSALAYEIVENEARDKYQTNVTREIINKQRSMSYQASIGDNQMPY